MPIYTLATDTLEEVPTTTFNSERILERQHLQAALKRQIDVIAPDCLVIAEEFSEWTESQRRIDLLAVDEDANLVVIELKRSESGEHMELQALRYAAMVSTLTFQRAVEIYDRYLRNAGSELDARGNLLEFLGWREPHEENFASDVRIILVSSDFSKELTTTVMWLNERSFDIRCVRLVPYKLGDKLLIDVQRIIPLPEAESYQVKVREQKEERREALKSAKDYTQYIFKGQEYSKRGIVLAVIQDWVGTHRPKSYAELVAAFPLNLAQSSLFVPADDAREIYRRQKIYRHFLGDGELVEFPDGSRYAIRNQWGKDTIGRFLEHARGMGYEILEDGVNATVTL